MALQAVRTRQPRWQDVSHLGLRWDRFNPSQDDDVDVQAFREERSAFLQGFEQYSPEARDVYGNVFKSWKATLDARDAVSRAWKARGRVAFGAGDTGMLEVGLRLHRTYGVPVIAGSAQKGLVRRFAPRAGFQPEDVEALLGKPGDDGMAAAVAFHDALWDPSSKDSPLVRDTITVHHPDYYQGDAAPADWDSPNPIAALSARGAFLFAVEGHRHTALLALRLLGAALQSEGIGAKTLKGYGRFEVLPADSLQLDRQAAHLFEANAGTRRSPLPASGQRSSALGHERQPPPVEHVAERAFVSYQPNTGWFEIAITHEGKSLKALTGPSPSMLFSGQSAEEQKASMETVKTRCRKKGAIPARVTFVAHGARIEVKRIEPL